MHIILMSLKVHSICCLQMQYFSFSLDAVECKALETMKEYSTILLYQCHVVTLTTHLIVRACAQTWMWTPLPTQQNWYTQRFYIMHYYYKLWMHNPHDRVVFPSWSHTSGIHLVLLLGWASLLGSYRCRLNYTISHVWHLSICYCNSFSALWRICCTL